MQKTRLSKFHITGIIATLLLVYFISGAYLDQYSWWSVAVIAASYLACLVAGSIFIRFNFYLFSKNNLYISPTASNTPKKIALTFDDGPAAYTGKILDILRSENVAATFFLIGKNIESNSAILMRMQEEGHAIGNHSYNHGFNFDWQSSTAMQKEIEHTNNIIKSITGIHTTLFRPPYGVTNPNLAKAIRKSNMHSIGWSLRSLDTVAKDSTKLLNKIMSSVKNKDIILLHDSCAITADILPKLISELKYRGYDFVTADN